MITTAAAPSPMPALAPIENPLFRSSSSVVVDEKVDEELDEDIYKIVDEYAGVGIL
jgi:hypothetical protein